MATILWIYLAGCVIVYAGLHTKSGKAAMEEVVSGLVGNVFSADFWTAILSMTSWLIIIAYIYLSIKDEYRLRKKRKTLRYIKCMVEKLQDKYGE